MPSKNTIRLYAAETYYHVYNRGVGKQPIFLDARDKAYFIKLLARYLDLADDSVRADGYLYDKYDVDLICYCLMNNHFHLLLYQKDSVDAVSQLMRSVSTAYSMYFNLRYKRVGPLFQGKFKASLISEESYLAHITRYIHLNPRTYKTYKWSSLPEYLGKRHTDWIHHERLLDMTPEQYMAFLEDYKDQKQLYHEIKNELAL